MEHDYDYIIIGSGFGGSVSALRLSQKGYKVLVIEKGKWYKAKDFAKTNWNIRKWLWFPLLRCFGIMKLTILKHVAIISGTGVGGGSLVYANTLPIPEKDFYTTGSWGNLNDWETELKPFYQIALKMLGAAKTPKLFEGDIELKQLAEAIGKGDKFEQTTVAVFFGKENETVSDPYFGGEGPDRTGCNFCGGCMTGCRNDSKNTLDKNYLHLAQKEGAEILAENEVYDVAPVGSETREGYVVKSKSSTGFFKRKEFVSKGIVFAGGVLGTVKLLLKLKNKSLPMLSDKLGQEIRTNNETLVSVSKADSSSDVSRGVAIGSILHIDEKSHLEVVRYSEGSGFWKLFHLPYSVGNNAWSRLFKTASILIRSPWAYVKMYVLNSWSKTTVVLLFMQTIDSTLKFKRNIFGLMSSSIGQGNPPSPFIKESIELTKKYSQITKGKPSSFALESIAGIPSTAHILGGAVMGENKETGVIDKDNRVFGYRDMYVIDGSMISANPGVNPALSITAIAERAMNEIPKREAI